VARYDHIDFSPPSGVREEAAKGLAWRREYGRGGTAVGVARARDLSNGTTISPETARRMKAFFDRHQSDRQGEGWSPGETGFPSNGRIAHALWGGDSGYSWSRKLVTQMNAADENDRSTTMNIERRSLAIDEVESAVPLLAVESRSEDDGSEREYIVGYAAKFGVLSLELEGSFIERIDPGAFGIVAERRGRRRPLETRALWNHDANYPLARYPGTLSLKVDEVGLRYEFPVPDTTYGRDIAANIRAAIVRGSSFSFTVPSGGDAWSVEDGRSVRVINRIDSLLDVGPVTFPAYPDADVKVAQRSYDAFVRQRDAEAHRRMAAATRARELREYLTQHGR
jgi:HK97 family phage prohead protease